MFRFFTGKLATKYNGMKTKTSLTRSVRYSELKNMVTVPLCRNFTMVQRTRTFTHLIWANHYEWNKFDDVRIVLIFFIRKFVSKYYLIWKQEHRSLDN